MDVPCDSYYSCLLTEGTIARIVAVWQEVHAIVQPDYEPVNWWHVYIYTSSFLVYLLCRNPDITKFFQCFILSLCVLGPLVFLGEDVLWLFVAALLGTEVNFLSRALHKARRRKRRADSLDRYKPTAAPQEPSASASSHGAEERLEQYRPTGASSSAGPTREKSDPLDIVDVDQ
jgi:hypothetical protein